MSINLHTHSLYCDGKDSVEVMIAAAIEKGFKVLGFSSHAPMPFENHYAIKNMDELRRYAQEVRVLAEKYSHLITVFLSLEIDYIPGMTTPFQELSSAVGLDYTIGGIHLVQSSTGELWFVDGPDSKVYDKGLIDLFDHDIKKGVGAYYRQVNEMIEKEHPDIIAHIDKIKMHNRGRYFKEQEKWYVDLTLEALALVRDSGAVLEVNTRGIYKKRSESLFPDIPLLQQALQWNIPICISSDAHHRDELQGGFELAVSRVKEAGYNEFYCFSHQGWKHIPLDMLL